MIKFSVLGSSSSGNCVFVQVDKTQILLDCGFSYKKTKGKLASIGKNVDDIEAVFISHSHGDHIKGVNTLLKKHPGVSIYSHAEKENPRLCNIYHGQAIVFGNAIIIPFHLDHDVVCHGFLVVDNEGNRLAYVTDTNTVPCESLRYLLGCHAIIVEANHDTQILADCGYPIDTKERAFNTHMRNEQAADLMGLVAWEGLKFVVPYHLSQTSNQERLAFYEVANAVYNAMYDGRVMSCKVICAKKDKPMEVMTLI